jgi:plastocyanin
MMRRTFVRVLAISALAALTITPARAESTCTMTPLGEACAGGVIVSGPSSKTTNFLTIAAVAQKGGPLTYVNADIESHNVVSCHFNGPTKVCDYGPDTQPWCFLYTAGKCPLFWSPTLNLSLIQVQGLENVQPGVTYGFICEPHAGTMRGTLAILPEAA